MNRDQWIGILFAIAIHLLVLFALPSSEPPIPFPMGKDPVQVSLVAAAPERARDLNPPAAEPTPEEGALLPPEESPPKPQSTPPPVTPPPTLLPTPEPLPTAQPAPTVSPTATPKLKPSGPQPKAQRNKSKLTEKQMAALESAAEKIASKSPQKTQSANARSGTVTGGGRGDVAPSYRNNPQPEYPEEARQLEQQGMVMLDVLVSADGRAAEVVVKRSSGYRILDQAAVAAVRHWSFQPGRTAGLPVASRVDVPVRFRLNR